MLLKARPVSSAEARVGQVERRLEVALEKMDAMRDTLGEVKTSNAVLEAKTDALQVSMDATRKAVDRLTEAIQSLVVAESANKASRDELAAVKRDVEELKAARWKIVGFALGAGAAGGASAVAIVKGLLGAG